MAGEPPALAADAALVVVDAQAGFDEPSWGRRNNPDADTNIADLVEAFRASGRPIVLVRHHSSDPRSPLHPSHPGNRLKGYLRDVTPQLLVTKSVNSSFHGTPDLHSWLAEQGTRQIVVCGITTNHCCETTARVGGNLGYDVLFAADATHTFDRTGPDGTTLSADELTRATVTNLHGEFATVVSTRQLLDDAH